MWCLPHLLTLTLKETGWLHGVILGRGRLRTDPRGSTWKIRGFLHRGGRTVQSQEPEESRTVKSRHGAPMAIGMPTSGALAKQRGNQKGTHREMSVPYGGSES